MIKKIISFSFAIILLTTSAVCYDTPNTISEAAVVINADSGQVLYEKDINSQRVPASITKLMTALVVFDSGVDLNDTTTISYKAVHSIDYGSTHIALTEDEVISLRDCMYAMLIGSANDAANVLAEHVGGTLENFTDMMNQKATELGCKNTNFQNANGLDEENHYTSAYDMALIAQALFKYDEFLNILSTTSYDIQPTNKQTDIRYIRTKVNMIIDTSKYYNTDVIGAKTGWTTKARHTLVTFAERNGQKLIVVTMNSNNKYDKFEDTIALLNYSYDSLSKITIPSSDLYSAATKYYSDQVLKPVEASFTDITLSLTENDISNDLKFTFSDSIKLGTISVKTTDGTYRPLVSFKYDLAEQLTVPAINNSETTANKGNAKVISIIKTIGIIIGIIFLLFLLLVVFICYRNHRYAKRRRERLRRKYYR